MQFRDPAPNEAQHFTGELGPGALYTVDKPANWNGGLVIWAHGYSVPTDPIHVPNLGPLLPFFLSSTVVPAVYFPLELVGNHLAIGGHLPWASQQLGNVALAVLIAFALRQAERAPRR